MKHAFLIIAHNEFGLLQELVYALDDARNDLFIHFDAKVPVLPAVTAQKSPVHILDRRIDVRWGDVSQIETELALFEAAAASGEPYAYYHLISGVDLPLKDPDAFHHFFEEHAGKEFIGYAVTEMTPELVRKACRWHLFPKHFRDAGLLRRGLRSACIKAQEILRIRRNRDISFKKGANWVSITDGMARYFIAHKDWIRKTFTHSFCCDELVMQTLCWDSPYRENLYDTTDEWKGNLRLIGWKDGCLYDWTAEDFSTLARSNALFARKFNSSDMDFIRRVRTLSAS